MMDVIEENESNSFSKSVLPLLLSSNKASRDPRSIRLAAVTSALIETIQERRKGENSSDVTAIEIFSSSLTALEGTMNSNSNDSAQIPLLQILEYTIPYLDTESTFYISQFALLSRTLRGIALSSSAAPSQLETADELGGVNAKTRQVMKTTTSCLRLYHSTITPSTNTSLLEKSSVKLLYTNLLEKFDDGRPKVRKTAHGSVLELLHTESIQKNVSGYVHEILSSVGPNTKWKETKLLHLLNFLEVGISRLRTGILAEDLMKLLILLKNGEATWTEEKVLVTNGVSATLISLMESHESGDEKVFTELSSRILATLLANSKNASVPVAVYPLQSRLMSSCLTRLSRSDKHTDILLKFLPLSVQILLNFCMSEEERVTRSCMVELNKLLRTLYSSPSMTRSCISKSSAAFGKILHFRCQPNWGVGLLTVYANFVVITKSLDMIEKLVGLRNTVGKNQEMGKVVESAVGVVIEGVGVQCVWEKVKMEDGKGVSKSKTWLLPLFKNSTAESNLSFFQTTILPLARKHDSLTADESLTELETSLNKDICIQLWSLFLPFSHHPTDISTTLPALAKIIVRALRDFERYPQLIPIICNSLVCLAKNVRDRDPDGEAADSQMLATASTTLLPILFSTMEKLVGGAEGDTATRQNYSSTVTDAIATLSKITPGPFLQVLFQKILTKLLPLITSADGKAPSSKEIDRQIQSLLQLSHALLISSSLEKEEKILSFLYRAMKPILLSPKLFSDAILKKSFKVLHGICENYPGYFECEGERFWEVVEVLVKMEGCPVSATGLRLKCLDSLMGGLKESNTDDEKFVAIIPQILSNVLLLSLKDSNGKTREGGYSLLLTLASLYSATSLTPFLQLILGGFGGCTPTMRSASVMALSRLAYEFGRGDNVTTEMQTMLPQLLSTVLILFDENHREVNKACIGFVRVCITLLKTEELEAKDFSCSSEGDEESLLEALVRGIMKYGKGSGRFRSKIKIILKKLVRWFGYERIGELVPPGDSRLITHMRKVEEREKRKRSKGITSTQEEEEDFEDMMDDEEVDSDNGRTLMTGVTGFTRLTAKSGKTVKTAATMMSKAKSVKSDRTGATDKNGSLTGAASRGMRIREESGGEVHDMLDSNMAKNVRFDDNNNDGDYDTDDDEIMQFDETGRLVVHDDLQEDKDTQSVEEQDDDVDAENEQIKGGGKRRRISKFESVKVAKVKANNEKNKKKKDKKDPKSLGNAYKSKKAGGDVKKKGQQYEPYAYVPLDGRSYTKKNRGDAVKQMQTVVKKGKRKYN